jgi:NAD kinase
MKTAVITRDKQEQKRIEQKLTSDGSLVRSERLYPGIPKVALRGSPTSKTHFYEKSLLDTIIKKIKQKNYTIKQYTKLTAKHKTTTLEALNEIQLHNKNPTTAIRFNIYINNRLTHKNIIGDGALAATPFGSTAYYYSTGGEPFDKGIGLSFNNPHQRIRNSVIPEDSTITIELLRGDALIIHDNNPKILPMKPKDKITIKKSNNIANFLRFTGL